MHQTMKTLGIAAWLLSTACMAPATDEAAIETSEQWELIGYTAESAPDPSQIAPPPEGDASYVVLEDGRVFRRDESEIAESSLGLDPETALDEFAGAPDDTPDAPDGLGTTRSPVLLGSDDRHVFTNQSSLTQYPYRTIGAIVTSSTGSRPVCTGTLVGPRHVLTAAHCLYNNNGWYGARCCRTARWPGVYGSHARTLCMSSP
jgi:V8-like Glu-specific endopeptidase